MPIDGVYYSNDKEPLLTLGTSLPWKSGGGGVSVPVASGDGSPARDNSEDHKKSAEAMV